MDGSPKQETPQGLTPTQKSSWNDFIDFVAKQGQANNPQLDQRNKNIGMALLQKFNYANPQKALPMDIVTKVQQDIQNSRTDLVNKWRKDPSVITDPIKSEDEIMSGISKVDGWLGTKTLNHRFPVAVATKTTNGKTTTTNYGTDIQSYANEVKPKKL